MTTPTHDPRPCPPEWPLWRRAAAYTRDHDPAPVARAGNPAPPTLAGYEAPGDEAGALATMILELSDCAVLRDALRYIDTPAGLAALIAAAQRERARRAPEVYRCQVCGSEEIQWQDYVHLNTDRPLNDDGGESWCPECENHEVPVCRVQRADGFCVEHARPFTDCREEEKELAP